MRGRAFWPHSLLFIKKALPPLSSLPQEQEGGKYWSDFESGYNSSLEHEKGY
jgi:hypothetical protein